MQPIGVIGGSGFYGLDDAAPHDVDTPYGPATVCRTELAGRPVAFIARHGAGHRLPPHRVPYRANVWALRELGVDAVIASFACGSLVPAWGPGTLVVPDQLIDRTRARTDTFHDDFADGPQHAPFADPYDPGARRALLAGAAAAGEPVVDGATVVVVDGPRFATRAESRWYRMAGADVINMTQYPEAVLARELGIAYGAIGLVTDHDAAVEVDAPPVTQEAVFATFERHLPRLRAVVTAAVGAR